MSPPLGGGALRSSVPSVLASAFGDGNLAVPNANTYSLEQTAIPFGRSCIRPSGAAIHGIVGGAGRSSPRGRVESGKRGSEGTQISRGWRWRTRHIDTSAWLEGYAGRGSAVVPRRESPGLRGRRPRCHVGSDALLCRQRVVSGVAGAVGGHPKQLLRALHGRGSALDGCLPKCRAVR